MSKPKLKLIKNKLSHEERIQARIDGFRRELLDGGDGGDGDMEYARDILAIVHDYMMMYSDEDVIMSSIRIKESIFYIDHFLSNELC